MLDTVTTAFSRPIFPTPTHTVAGIERRLAVSGVSLARFLQKAGIARST